MEGVTSTGGGLGEVQQMDGVTGTGVGLEMVQVVGETEDGGRGR